jgi:16S rRNA (guanine527-N7)-methyltransferase
VSAVAGRLAELAERYALPREAPPKLARLLELVADEPSSITSVRDPADAVDVHIADSLSGLAAAELKDALSLADLGAGGGFPGLVLAIALPDARVTLIESVGRKADFLRRASEALGLANVAVVADRAESWSEGSGSLDAVTARALAPLAVLLEYAAPLLRHGGTLVAWKGRRDEHEERAGAVAAALLGMSAPRARRVTPFDGAGPRHLYLSSKVSSTPNRFPRRPGMARKRPLGP